MALSRGYILLSVLLLAATFTVTVAGKAVAEEVPTVDRTAVVAPAEEKDSADGQVRTLRAANPAPEPQQPRAVAPATAANPDEQQFEQQILVVRGNPSKEKLDEEIRKALRSLIGEGEADQVQIRQLKDVNELRRVVPGAGPGPIGLQVVP